MRKRAKLSLRSPLRSLWKGLPHKQAVAVGALTAAGGTAAAAVGAKKIAGVVHRRSFWKVARDLHRQFHTQGYTYENWGGGKRTIAPDGYSQTDCSHFLSSCLYAYLEGNPKQAWLPENQLKSWDFANIALYLNKSKQPWYGPAHNRLSAAEVKQLAKLFKLVHVKTGATKRRLCDKDAARKGDILVYTKAGTYGTGHVEVYVGGGHGSTLKQAGNSRGARARRARNVVAPLTVISCGRESDDWKAYDSITVRHRTLGDVDYILRLK